MERTPHILSPVKRLPAQGVKLLCIQHSGAWWRSLPEAFRRGPHRRNATPTIPIGFAITDLVCSLFTLVVGRHVIALPHIGIHLPSGHQSPCRSSNLVNLKTQDRASPPYQHLSGPLLLIPRTMADCTGRDGEGPGSDCRTDSLLPSRHLTEKTGDTSSPKMPFFGPAGPRLGVEPATCVSPPHSSWASPLRAENVWLLHPGRFRGAEPRWLWRRGGKTLKAKLYPASPAFT